LLHSFAEYFQVTMTESIRRKEEDLSDEH